MEQFKKNSKYNSKKSELPKRIYLKVPISEKEDAKAHKCRWDPSKKKWWIAEDLVNEEVLRRWKGDSSVPSYATSVITETTTEVSSSFDELDSDIPATTEASSSVSVIDLKEETVRAKTDTTLRGWFDGGSRGNPGQCGFGALLRNGNGSIYSVRMGAWQKGTNNEAEYAGCIELLQMIISAIQDKQKTAPSKDMNIEVYGDSNMIIKQLNGEYACKASNLIIHYEKANSLVMIIKKMIGEGKITFTHVLRQFNKGADALANLVMNQISK